MTITRVIPIAMTNWLAPAEMLGAELGWAPDPISGPGTSAGEQLGEFAGRACYQSWKKPNPATASTADYIKNILEIGHLSVLEHASVTFYIEHTSRSLTHELVRHRHLSYSQLSQRFVNEPVSTEHRITPPLFKGDPVAQEILEDAATAAEEAYNKLVERGEEIARIQGITGTMAKKRPREAARAVLPNMTPTSIVVTGNFRAWLWFLEKRFDEAADLEIFEVAKQIGWCLHGIAENVFPAVEL